MRSRENVDCFRGGEVAVNMLTSYFVNLYGVDGGKGLSLDLQVNGVNVIS